MKNPTPILQPLTEEARKSIKEPEIQINKFPFRIGRQSRSGIINSGNELGFDRRKPGSSPNNDYYMIDSGGRHLNISREHIQIERKDDNTYEIKDLNSFCGTIVDDHNIGRSHKVERYPLKNGSVIVIGTSKSPYIFKFVLPSA